MTRHMRLAALASCLLVPAAAQAQGTAPKAAVSDMLFASAAADCGMAEVMMSELGVQKATHPDLKKFSEHMVAMHTKMNAELTKLASSKGATLPKAVTDGHKFCYQNLAGLSGEEFDGCYAKAQLIAHMGTLAAFEAEAERGQDPEMKAFAAKGVAHIKEHIKEIKPIAMHYEKMEKEKKGEK